MSMSTRDEIGRNELLEGLDGNLFITDRETGEQVVINLEHRAAVAAALCPPAAESREMKHATNMVVSHAWTLVDTMRRTASEQDRRLRCCGLCRRRVCRQSQGSHCSADGRSGNVLVGRLARHRGVPPMERWRRLAGRNAQDDVSPVGSGAAMFLTIHCDAARPGGAESEGGE